MNCKDVTELLVLSFARTNPVFFRDFLQGLPDSHRRENLAARILDLTSSSAFTGHGGKEGPAGTALQEIYPVNTPKMAGVVHAFPVYSQDMELGMMVPLAIDEADDWHVSDAFGCLS